MTFISQLVDHYTGSPAEGTIHWYAKDAADCPHTQRSNEHWLYASPNEQGSISAALGLRIGNLPAQVDLEAWPAYFPDALCVDYSAAYVRAAQRLFS